VVLAVLDLANHATAKVGVLVHFPADAVLLEHQVAGLRVHLPTGAAARLTTHPMPMGVIAIGLVGASAEIVAGQHPMRAVPRHGEVFSHQRTATQTARGGLAACGVAVVEVGARLGRLIVDFAQPFLVFVLIAEVEWTKHATPNIVERVIREPRLAPAKAPLGSAANLRRTERKWVKSFIAAKSRGQPFQGWRSRKKGAPFGAPLFGFQPKRSVKLLTNIDPQIVNTHSVWRQSGRVAIGGRSETQLSGLTNKFVQVNNRASR